MTRARVLGAALAAALVLAAPAAADPGCPGADGVVGAQDASALAGPTLCLLNAERRAAGLRPVAGQQKLAVAAARFSAEMVRERFFEHRAPGGPDLTGRLTLALTFALLCAGSIWVSADLWPAHEMTEALAIPLRPFRLFWIVCSGAGAVHFAIQFVRRLRA